MTRNEVRLRNALILVEEAGGPAEFAKRIGMSDSQASQIIGKNPTRGIGNAVAPRIEEAFGKPSGWLDQPPSEDPDTFSATGTVTPALTPRQQALISLFDGLTEGQQDEEIRRLEAQKQSNEAIVSELTKRRA